LDAAYKDLSEALKIQPQIHILIEAFNRISEKKDLEKNNIHDQQLPSALDKGQF